MTSSRLIASALLTIAALPRLAGAEPAPMPTYASEKCYGVAATNANDCATASHSCAGQSRRAKDPASWIYVPAGTCAKIEGASLTGKG